MSRNNIKYNISSFDGDLRQRVKKGLEDSVIKMKYCALSTNEDENVMKRFYIHDEIIVSIRGELRSPTCTCGANEKGLACRILSTVRESFSEQPVQFSSDGSTIQSTTPVEILNAKGLDVVAGELKWMLKKEDFSDDEDNIKEELTDVLSVFDEALPGYLESPLAMERSRKYQEFARLFSEHAVRDPGLFLKLRNIIDSDFQRNVFFDKINNRITGTFDALHNYIAYGPTGASPDAQRIDVTSCAERLRALVNAIDEFCHEQDKDDPELPSMAVRAAAALVKILDRVVKQNVNSYEHVTWGLEAPSNPIENNLFVALIGSHVDGDTMFVLDALRSLPQEDVLRSHWEPLQSIEQELVEAGTPSSYKNAFRCFVHGSRKRALPETCEGERKRTRRE
ncbi:hypothetical protein ACEQ8H_000087 [Pleosporales sp. CAS-2024a]